MDYPADGGGVRQRLRGELARDYVVGSLHHSARQAPDLPYLAPRALRWYQALLEVGIAAPFGVVLDLGYLLLDGEAFRFRSFFADARLQPQEGQAREEYESRVLVRRLQERNFGRLRRLVRDNAEMELALIRVLELLLRPATRALRQRFLIEDAAALGIDFHEMDPHAALERFESAVGARGIVLRQIQAIAEQSPAMDLDTLLQAEDFYEIEHIRVFPRESLREVARRIKMVERLLGAPERAGHKAMRSRALAETTLSSVGTYPTGGIAELTTSGPLENLAPSELVYLEPEEDIDAFLVRFAEGSLLKYLRDSSVHRMMRRTVVFCLDECLEFLVPVTGGALHGTKVVRCLLGLLLAVTADLLTVFRRDDIEFRLRLIAPPGASADTSTERREIADVLHLLFREKEEQGTARIELVTADFRTDLGRLRREPSRHLAVVAISRADRLRGLAARTSEKDIVLVPVAVHVPERHEEAPGVQLDLAGDALESLRAGREAILQQVVG